MPDPINPTSFPSLKPEKVEGKMINKFIDIFEEAYKKKSKNFFLERRVLKKKMSSKAEGIKDIKITQLSAVNLSKTNKNDPSAKADPKFQKPSFLSKLKVLFLRIRSPLKGSKMSDKKPGRPMLYPYTFSAKIAQFPLKFYINNNWMWKYYFLAVAVSFPLFYKIGRASNSPENVKTWEEIRKRDFTPGGHH